MPGQSQKSQQCQIRFSLKGKPRHPYPLNGIIGMTNLALDKNIPDDIRKYLINIDKCSHFLLSLVNDILDLRKVETGNLELHPEPLLF